MPPDFMAFGPVIEHGTDRYSVGVILYELLVNSAPYQVTRQADGMPAFSGPIPATDARSDVPSEVSDFLMKGVAPQAADRFATADEMARAWRSLEPLLQGLP
jgi:serine/threonine-protein kinase